MILVCSREELIRIRRVNEGGALPAVISACGYLSYISAEYVVVEYLVDCRQHAQEITAQENLFEHAFVKTVKRFKGVLTCRVPYSRPIVN